MSATTPPARVELPELTSARFLAAIAVLLGHFSHFLQLPQSMSWMLGGYGVSFFFVLSGFILCYRYWDDFAGGVRTPSYRRFFAARVARIYPSHVLALVLITALYFAIRHYRPQQITFPPDPVLSWTANALALQTFAPSYLTQQAWNGPSWSVSTEISFYVLCPFILAMIARRVRGARGLVLVFAGAAVLAAAVQTATLFAVLARGADAGFWLEVVGTRNILWRINDFIAGVVAARLLFGGHLEVLRRSAAARNALLAGGLAAVAIVNALPWPADTWPHLIMRQYRLYIAYMLPFAAVVVALAAGPTFLTPVLARPFATFLGNASYGVYIYHWIGWTAVSHAVAAGVVVTPRQAWAVVAAIIAFSAVSYVAFEKPMRRWIRAALSGGAPGEPQEGI